MNTHKLPFDRSQFAHGVAGEIKRVCKTYEGRFSGSESEKEYAAYIAEKMQKSADEVRVEPFSVYPEAFFGCLSYVVCGFILAYAAYFFSTMVSLMLIVAATLPYIIEFALYRRATDPLYKRSTSQNVTAIKHCSGEVKRRLFFVVHYDAGKEWRLKYLMGGTVFVIHRILNAVGALYFIAIDVVRWALVGGIGASIASGVMLYLGAAGAIFLIPIIATFFFVDGKRVIDGANDGLSGCVTAGTVFASLKNVKFENTEIGVIYLGSQSVGLRGAMAWCDAHKGDYGDEAVFVTVNILHDKDYITACTRELNGFVKNDPDAVSLAADSAKAAGVPIRVARSYYANTDSAIFSRNGLKSVGVNAVSKHLPEYYRTRHDTYENLSEDCIDAGAQIMLKMIELYSGEYTFEFPETDEHERELFIPDGPVEQQEDVQ